MEENKSEVINSVVLKMYNILNQDQVKRLQNLLYIELSDYELVKKKKEVVIFEGDATENIIKKFLVVKKIKGLTDRSLKHYRDELIKIFAEIKKNPMEVTQDDIRIWIANRQLQDKVTITTINNGLRVLSTFYQWMMDDEIIKRNPMAKIDKLKEKKQKKIAFTEMELEKLRYSMKNSMETALLEVLISTWARVTEIMQIRIDEIEDGKVIVHGKGNKDRVVFLNAKAMIAIDKFIGERKDNNPFLFPNRILNQKGSRNMTKEWYKIPENVGTGHRDISSTEQLIKKRGRANGIAAHPHKFRRTGATMALRAGMPIQDVSKILGHESIETTQIYLEMNDSEIEMSHRKYAR